VDLSLLLFLYFAPGLQIRVIYLPDPEYSLSFGSGPWILGFSAGSEAQKAAFKILFNHLGFFSSVYT
jgi:hypothetical protein